MELSEGTVIAGYTIEAELGEGGMGIVYRARHPKLPRSDALKILASDLGREDEARARFLREAELAASLNHPHIVTVFDRGETGEGDDKRLWIAMQLIEGSDAEKEMKAGRMPPNRVIKILREVASALDYAHRRKILHRDVKPANFLLSDEDDRAYLADFGISRALDEVSSVTRTGIVMASIPFIAPESLKGGAVAVDYRADIYSLGCSAFMMLTGKAPFYRSDVGGVAGVMSAHLLQAPPSVTELVPALPRAVDAVIAKVMAKEPSERYQTASEFAAAIAQAITTGTAHTSTTKPWQPIAAPPATAPGLISAGYAPGPTGPYVGGPPAGEVDYPSGYFSGPNARSAGVAAAAAPLHRRRRRLLTLVAVLVLAVALVGGSMLWLHTRDQTPPYQAQTVSHIHGDTHIATAPRAVAALGPGDADAVLALGVQPVALTAPSGIVPDWEQAALTSEPSVLASIDTTAVAAAHPDLIIATGDLDDATFAKLNDIAPTVGRPAAQPDQEWDWQAQLTWVGKVLGREAKAEEQINGIRSLQGDLGNQNPVFKGKSIEVVTVSNSGVAHVLAPSFTVQYLESLGFRYDQELLRTAADTGNMRPIGDLNRIYRIETDYLIVIRTDSAAHGGGYSGLPKQFSTYSGKMLVVDDASTVAALTGAGGSLAVKFLDDKMVNALASA